MEASTPAERNPLKAAEKKLLVIVPTYNEAGNISEILLALSDLRATAQLSKMDVLVVDDSSPDGTADVVTKTPGFREQVFLLTREKKAGFGPALRAGFDWGLERPYSIFVTMDGDGSHEVSSIPSLLEPLAREDGQQTAVVIGSRYVYRGRTQGWPIWRRTLSGLGGLGSRLLLGVRAADPTSGFRAYNVDWLRRLPLSRLSAKHFAIQIQLLFFLSSLGGQYHEVPIVFLDRRKGKSKLGYATVLEAMSLLFRMRQIETVRPKEVRNEKQVIHRAPGTIDCHGGNSYRPARALSGAGR